MGRRLYILVLLGAALLLGGSGSDLSGVKYTVNVHRASYLVIQGTTNVGDFNCSFEGNVLHDTIEVVLAEDENGCLNFSDLEFSLPVFHFDCRNNQMNRDFRELLNYQEYPEISWQIICMDITGLDRSRLKSKDNFQINTLLRIAGEQREYWIPVDFVRDGKNMNFSGNLPIDITDFSLSPPSKFFGLVQVYPTISIDFSIEVSLL